MSKDYSTVNFTPGDTIENAVNQLLEYRGKGQLVRGKFNGVTLYSDTVTLTSAYKEITGKTKVEFDEEQEEWKRLKENIFRGLAIPKEYLNEKPSSVLSAEMNKEMIKKKWKETHGLDLKIE